MVLRARFGSVAFVVGACLVLLASAARAQPVPPAPPPPSASASLQPAATWAQLAAYEQYLLYLSLTMNNQPSSAPAPDANQYFRNGAAVTTVPSAGQPGSAYFSNGAAVTSVPSAGPGAAYFTNGAEATRYPLAPSTVSPPPAPAVPPVPPQPSVEGSVSPPPPSAAPSASPRPGEVTAGAPLSFQAWLQTMGASVAASEAPAPPLAAAASSGAAEAPPLAEPSSEADDARQRAAYPLPEKPRVRFVLSHAGKRVAAFVTVAFAFGLLLGALAMRRAANARARSTR